MDEEMYFIDTRNADRIIRPTAIVPTRVVAPPAASPSRVYGGPSYTPPPSMTYAPPAAVAYPASSGYPQAYPPASYFGPAPVYSPGPIYGQPPYGGPLGGLFGGLNLGDVVKLAADAFAAFKSLPAQPTPTGDVATDVANEVVYTAALAKDATTRKQIEFGGEIAGRLGRGMMGAW